MTGVRKLQVAAAFTLGVILPCAVTLWFLTAQVADRPSIVGGHAADFEVTAITGDVHKLSGYDGSRLALLFVNFDCPACVEQLSYLDKLNREVGSHDLEILAVSESSYDKTSAFADDFALSFPLVIDDGSVRSDYRISCEPTLVLVDERGTVRFHKCYQFKFGSMRQLLCGFAREGKIPLGVLADTDAHRRTEQEIE